MRAPRVAAIRRLITILVIVLVVAGCAAGVSGPSSGPGATGGPAVTQGPSSAATPTPLADGLAQVRPIEGANLLAPQARDLAPATGDEAMKALARSNAEFALDVYRKLAAAGDGNIVLGPHSISSSLAMLYVGARGATATEMAQVMHLTGEQQGLSPAFNALDLALASRSQEGVVDLRTANQGFAAPGLPFVDSYLATLGRDFGAPMAELAFTDVDQAREVINKWAEDRTNGRITDLFPPGVLDASTVLVLVNAISMDAAWKYLFDPAQTRSEPFNLADGSTVDVPTMHFDLYLPLVTGDDYDAVELPYGDGDLSMVVILPGDPAKFDDEVTAERLQGIFDSITDQGIHLSLPKFSFKSHTPMDDILKGLGMTGIYESADLSGMLGGSGFFLQTVQHEAFIEVDEEGTEAHAATGTAVAASHGPTITFDGPFFFVIRDRATGAILFLGRVTDPRG